MTESRNGQPSSEQETQRGGSSEGAPDTDPDTSSRQAPSVEIVEVSTSAPPTADERDSGVSTLLSAPAPASSYEVEIEDRLTRLERTLSRLTGRVESLEAENAHLHEQGRGPEQKPWPWLIIVACLLLVAGYLLFQR